jgi:hypothetical protein
MRKGDIVTILGHSGAWIFAGLVPEAMPPNAGKFLRATLIESSNRFETLTIGIDSALVIASPLFLPGLVVDYERESATVVNDNGDGTVRLEFERRPQVGRYPDERFHQVWRVDADKAQLVVGCIDRFTQQGDSK